MIGNPFSGQKQPNKPGGFSSNYTSDWSLPKNPWLEQTQPETQAAPEYAETAAPEAPATPSYEPPAQSHVYNPKQPQTPQGSGLMDQIFKRMVDPSAPGSLVDHTMPVRSSGGGGIFSSFLAPFKGSIKDLIGSAGIGAGSPIGGAVMPSYGGASSGIGSTGGFVGGASSLLDPNRFSNWEKDHPNEPLLARLDGGPVPPRMSEDEFNQQNGITPEMAARLKQMMSDGSVQF